MGVGTIVGARRGPCDTEYTKKELVWHYDTKKVWLVRTEDRDLRPRVSPNSL